MSPETSAVLTDKTYEVLDVAKAQGYGNVTTAYIDMAGCGGTYFSPKQGQMALKSFIWGSNIEGEILFTHGHVHEGGLNTVLWLNEQPICTSYNIYGRTPQSIDPSGKQHISDVSVCTNLGKIGRGDLVHITSVYDSVQHAFDEAMPKNGFEYIMAINNVRLTG